MKYKFLEHTADAKFQAFGKSLEEAFSNAALAMFSIMIEPSKVKNKIKKEFEVTGKDKKSLLYKFLEEILFLLDTDGFVLNKVEKLEIVNDKLKAVLVGDNIKDYKLSGDIKAVTYNDMEIKEPSLEKNVREEKGKSYMVQVVVDL